MATLNDWIEPDPPHRIPIPLPFDKQSKPSSKFKRLSINFIRSYFFLGLNCSMPIVNSVCRNLEQPYLSWSIDASLVKDFILPLRHLFESRPLFRLSIYPGVMHALLSTHYYVQGELDQEFWTVLESGTLYFYHRHFDYTTINMLLGVDTPRGIIKKTNSLNLWLSSIGDCLKSRQAINDLNQLANKYLWLSVERTPSLFKWWLRDRVHMHMRIHESSVGVSVLQGTKRILFSLEMESRPGLPEWPHQKSYRMSEIQNWIEDIADLLSQLSGIRPLIGDSEESSPKRTKV